MSCPGGAYHWAPEIPSATRIAGGGPSKCELAHNRSLLFSKWRGPGPSSPSCVPLASSGHNRQVPASCKLCKHEISGAGVLEGEKLATARQRNRIVKTPSPTIAHKFISQAHEPSGSGAKQKMLPGFSLKTLMNSHAWPVGLCWVSTGGLIFLDGTITFVPLAI